MTNFNNQTQFSENYNINTSEQSISALALDNLQALALTNADHLYNQHFVLEEEMIRIAILSDN